MPCRMRWVSRSGGVRPGESRTVTSRRVSTVGHARSVTAPAPASSARLTPIDRRHDVGRLRERRRQRRLARLAAALGVLCAWLWYRLLTGDPVGMPTLPVVDPLYLMSGLF